MALTVSATRRFRGPSEGALIRIAALCSVLGIALSITDDYSAFGKWFAVGGVILLIVGLHRFGRMGPDAALRFEQAPAPRKKRRSKQRPPAQE